MTSARTYWLVWLGLLALAGATLLLSFAPLGPFEIPVALTIASVKALVVVLFFMHAIEQRGSKWVYLLLAVLFVVILASLMVLDVVGRSAPRGMPARPTITAGSS